MILQTKNLIKTFTQGNSQIHAVNNIDISISAGESIAITGKSGSGKTTLLSLLTGLESSTSGDVIILDNPITKMNEKELGSFRANNIGIVFQQFHLMPHLTALENVTLALEIANSDNIRGKAMEALTTVGLKNRVHHLPSELSGGENQRVAIARAIVNNPKILFADEPSGNLDSITGETVMNLLFDLTNKNKMTLVLVTHDEQLALRCDRKINISNGKVL